MVDAVHGNTELGSTKEAIIAAIVQRELKFKAKLAPYFTDVSQFAVEGAKSIDFPKMSSFVVQKRVEGVAGDATVVNTSNDVLLLNQNAYVAWIVDKMTKKQSKIALQGALAQRAASAHGRTFDLDMIAAIETAAGLSHFAGTPTDIDRDAVLEMINFVEGNDGDLDDCVFTFSTDQRKALLKINEFSHQEIYGNNTIMTGRIPTLYGVPVVFHNGISSQQGFLAEKSSIVYGFQSAPEMDSQKANEYGVGATRDAMDQLYGIAGQQLGEKGLAATETPLIAKMRD